MTSASNACFRSLGIDLGVPNTALTLLQVKRRIERHERPRRGKEPLVTLVPRLIGEPVIVSSCMLMNPLSNLTDNAVVKRKKRGKKVELSNHAPFVEQLEGFLGEVRGMVSAGEPDKVTAERFIGRGFTPGGALMENISMMNMGFVSIGRRYRSEVSLCSSAIWKNQLNRTFGEMGQEDALREVLYPEAGAVGVSTHALDSAMIGLFGTGDPLCYKFLWSPVRRKRFFEALASAPPL